MSQINVRGLTFGYEGSFDNIFENVSFSIDTDWKLGFAGRNGKGKTTFLKLLLGEYAYRGSITGSTPFDYFPYVLKAENREKTAAEFLEELKPGCEQWRVFCEMDKLGLGGDLLYRKFDTLSFGEQTKLLLAVLFSGENDFLLLDEPTNHLDQESRETVKGYLKGKKGFILVSHDRDLLDACIDHILVLNRKTIEIQNGNFSSWEENKRRKDEFARRENEKHRKAIGKLREAAGQTKQWAEKSESSKIGFDPTKEHDRSIATRAYIGAKTKKMQSRVRQMEKRIDREIREQEGLLQDIEEITALKMMPLKYHKDRLAWADGYGLKYTDSSKELFKELNFEITQGERIFITGRNGQGKSTLLKKLMEKATESPQFRQGEGPAETGELRTASGLIVSYISQDTSFLKGSIREFCRERKLDESLFCAILRQMDMDRNQFRKNMEEFSEGQKKKVLLASSLLTPAHLYVWDEPLNYIDVFTRIQIENLLLEYRPTLLAVEHDVRFRQRTATRVLSLDEGEMQRKGSKDGEDSYTLGIRV